MKKALQYVVPVCFSALLLWYLFRKVNFHETLEIASHGVDFWWILAAMGISVFSHIFRAMRWKLQLDALGVSNTLMALICSIFGCYALNLVLPRVGELWRCTFIARRAKAPLTTVMGSMMADRLSDTITVLSLVLLTFVVAAPALAAFLAKYPIGADILHLLYSPWLWIGIVAVCLLGRTMLYQFRETRFIGKLRQWSVELWKGFAVVVTMPGRWKFLLLTIGVWGCYFIQLYVAFYAFGFTRALCHQPGLAAGLLPCLVAFVLSSIAMAVPSNGGLGPWNIAVMFGLAVYGITDTEGAAFSMLQWTGQTVMLIVLGIFTALRIALHSSNRQTIKDSNPT